MNRLTAFVLVMLVSACSAAPAAAPSPTGTASPNVASVSPSPTTAPTSVPTVAPTASPTLIPLPSSAAIIASSGTVVWTFVAFTRLFRSTDRGDTWQERPIPPSGANFAFAFADDREGWALTPGSPATQCQAQAVALSHTADAGATWQPVASTGFANPGCKDTVAFSDALHGYIGAYDPNSAPAIYRTTDGGRTWTASRPLPDPPGFRTQPDGPSLRVGTVKAFGQTLLVAASANNPAAGGLFAFRSSDGGATWTYASTAPSPIQDLAFVTATRWVQISSPGDSKETTDGGATWHAFATTYSQAAPIAPAIVFGDAQVGYATVRGAIQRTTDGGAHWTSIRTPGTF